MKPRFFGVLVAASFVFTVGGARLFSVFFPRIHWEPVPGLHIHHYVYGIFLLTAAGYLALIFKGRRATMWIALLYGLGVGLTFDEFGMWFNPPFVRGVRWNTNGIAFVLVLFAMMGLFAILSRSSTVGAVREAQARQGAASNYDRGFFNIGKTRGHRPRLQ